MDQKDFDERLHKLKLKIAEDKITKIEKQDAQRKQANFLKAEIHKLQPRIQKMILLANAMKENGIAFPDKDKMKKYGYFGSSIAEGFYHRIGFMGIYQGEAAFRENPICFVGFYNGGACGPFNFFTDGNDIFELHEGWDKLAKCSCASKNGLAAPFREATNGSMEKFLLNYSEFEASFLQWFDEEMTLNNPAREDEYETVVADTEQNTCKLYYWVPEEEEELEL